MMATAQLRTGVELPYVEQGDAAGVPVILLHGITDSWRSFEPVLPHLPRSLRAYALTQRGHGDASRPWTGYRTRDFAADVAAFMDAAGLERAIVVGHSMGSSNALRFALDYPGRALGLVLLGAFASYGDKAELAEFRDTVVRPLADPIDAEVAREFQLSTLARPVAPEFLDMVVRESLKAPAHVWRAAFEGLFEDDFAGELHRIQVPVLVAWGERDAFCPRADQDRLLATIAGARLAVYEGCGHALHWEEPRRFAGDLAAFAAGLGGAAVAAPASEVEAGRLA
jgi:pimeloyl-ACP methyl ester carboxylesterase